MFNHFYTARDTHSSVKPESVEKTICEQGGFESFW